jgi:hypothetical protein
MSILSYLENINHCVFVALIYYTLMEFVPLADYGGISHLLQEMVMPIIETHYIADKTIHYM